MEAVVVRRGETEPTVVERPRPEPDEGEALVEIHRVGVDGTDHDVIEGAHGGFPAGGASMVLGHEGVGVVADPNDTDLREGDVVVPTVRRPPDGTNAYFDRGEPDMAPEGAYVERGIDGAHGFMAEYVTSPAEFLVEVPAAIASYGVMVEPLSNVVKAVEHAAAARSAFEWQPTSALVLGNGPLGLLALALLVTDDRFERCYCLGRRDRPDQTIDVIERLGATYVDSRAVPVTEVAAVHEAVDLVVEATGHAPHAFESVRALAPNGVAALLGLPDDGTVTVDGGTIHRDLVVGNRALVGSVNSNVPQFETAAAALAEFPDWVPDALLTGVHKPEDAAAAFETGEGTIKEVVEFGQP